MFVSLEGIDRSGKTTQAELLAGALAPGALLVREPGGTELGERLRALLKDPAVELDPSAELLLFCAARSALATQVIAPARRAGREVVCDRYIDSTAAYQGERVGALVAGSPGRPDDPLEAGIELIESLNSLIVGDCVPDLTLLIRVDPEAAEARGQGRLAAGDADGADRFEGRGLEFQRRVAAAYDELARRHPGRIAVIDGEGDRAAVHERVLAAVEARR